MKQTKDQRLKTRDQGTKAPGEEALEKLGFLSRGGKGSLTADSADDTDKGNGRGGSWETGVAVGRLDPGAMARAGIEGHAPAGMEDGKWKMENDFKERIAKAPVVMARRDAIRIGTTNARKRFNIEDLKASIGELGITTALWVRRLPKLELLEPDMITKTWRVVKVLPHGGGHEIIHEEEIENVARMCLNSYGDFEYELIAGERRWRAAGELSIAEVPVKVFECSDVEARKLQWIENLQREDLTALEEAEGFREVVDSKIYGDSTRSSVEAMCAEYKVSRAHIYGRLALLKLAGPVRTALLEGKIEQRVASEISKAPEKAQASLLKQAVDVGFSVRQVQQEIERNWMRELEKAPFDVEKADYVLRVPGKNDGSAGPCKDCPARSGNMVEMYPNFKARPQLCTDIACFRGKSNASAAVVLDKAEKDGCRVVHPESAKHKELFRYGGDYLYSNDYVELNMTCHRDPKNRTYGQILKGVKPIVTVAPSGKTMKLLVASEVNGLLKQAGLKFEREDRQPTKEDKEAEFQQAVELAAAKWIIAELKEKKGQAEALRMVIGLKLENGEEFDDALKRRGVAVSEEGEFDPKALEEMDAQELTLILVEGELLHGDDRANVYGLRTAEKMMPVNRKDIEKQVKCQMAAKEKEAARVKAEAEKQKKLTAKNAKNTKGEKAGAGPAAPAAGGTLKQMALKEALMEVLASGAKKIRDIVEALEAGGFVFKSKNPVNSVGAYLYGPEGKEFFVRKEGGFVVKPEGKGK